MSIGGFGPVFNKKWEPSTRNPALLLFALISRAEINLMAIEHNSILHYVRAIFRDGVAAELSDLELLERFTGVARGDVSAEIAFAALIARHGPMVLRVCRAALRDEHDAQDAFQAVFLVLVHKARTLWARDSLGPWLHAVALRVSSHARASEMQRRIHERRYAALGSRSAGDHEGVADDSIATIHEELGRLPEGWRQALVLCDLEGLTHEEAAGRLGWPVGTVKSRQARGRNRLRERLVRRGFAPVSAGVAALLMAGQGRAEVPESLAASTVKTAVLVVKGSAVAALGSAATVSLARGALKAMFVSRLRIAVVVALILGGIVTTTGFAIQSAAGVRVGSETGTRAQSDKEAKPADDKIQRARELIYFFRSYNVFNRDEEWARTIRELATIGKAAVPELVAELDRADRDATIRSLAFSLRAIGDRRAVPALIRAIPKALRPAGSDCGVNIADHDLFMFMLANQNYPDKRPEATFVACGRPVNEILSALERLTNHSEPPGVGERDPLRHVFLGGTPDEQAQQRALFVERQKLWEMWWSKHWQEFVTQEELQSVELPKREHDVIEMAGLARYGPLFPTGPHIRLGPVRLLRLTQSAYWNGRSHLDFDTGRVFTQYEGARIADWGPPTGWGPRVGAWYMQNGIDVRCQGRLESIDLRLWQVEASRWKTLETDIQKDSPLALGQEVTRSMAFVDQERPNAPDDSLLTFLFTTREGGRGIVQIFPKDRDSDRFRLRYRMWLSPETKPAAQPPDGKVVVLPGEAKRPGSSFGVPLAATVAEPAEDQGFLTDLETGQKLTFLGPGMIAGRILPETFNELTPRDARELLERVRFAHPNLAWINIDEQLAERPDTFAFKTSEGVVGLLQFEQSEKEAGKLTIRYRIERPD
jgi:RNA polymerase sigma factor (sigma-70 family)